MLQVRPLEPVDFPAAARLGALAFGADTEGTQGWSIQDPVTRWGAFDPAGRLVGKAVDLRHGQWWGGRLLPACGVADVAVEPASRGQGIARQLLTAVLSHARDRGAAVAALYCTNAALYRSLGFETVGMLRRITVPTALLGRRVPPTVRLRAGGAADWPQLRAVYQAVTRGGQGLLDRVPPAYAEPVGPPRPELLPEAGLPADIDGLVLAEDRSGAPLGYLTWRRARGYGPDAVLTVPECHALSPDAALALLAVLGSWQPVAPTARLTVPPWLDPVQLALPMAQVQLADCPVWMHRVLGVAAAVEARGWAPALTGSVTLRLLDPLFGENARSWRLEIEAGEGRLVPADRETDLELTSRGWSLLWCGAARCAQLRAAGLLTGGTGQEDAALDLLLAAGGPAGLLTYF